MVPTMQIDHRNSTPDSLNLETLEVVENSKPHSVTN